MSSLSRVVVVGGHGKARPPLSRTKAPASSLADTFPWQVALHFARLASATHSVRSIVRSKDHFPDITARGAVPELLSLEESTVNQLAEVFEGARTVLFTAGAGGKGGAERTKAVDYEGAVKVSVAFAGES